MAGVSNGYRAALVRRQLTPGLISSLPGTARLPPFIYSSTSYPELGSVVCDSQLLPIRSNFHLTCWFVAVPYT